ncbi:transcriptional regulator domain-containing protein [Sphingobium lactosutens]|uniref:transcriptional regulator domain-containing protein n=1 Tax=Sphingobium lactosutens TaxID=522773 RepID=UPI0038B5421E
MQGARTSSCRPEIVERSVPQDAHLLTGSQMAWEILRRRADYRGQTYERRLLRTSPSLELIRTCRPLTSWGLCFRGRSGPDSTRRPPVLGGRGGHERHMRLGAPMSVH